MCNWPGGNESDPLCRLQHHKGTTHYFITIHTAVLQKLPVPQLVKKFSESYWTRKFTTAFTNARQLLLSWVKSILPTPQNPISSISVLILSSHLSVGLRSDLFYLGFCTRSLQTLLSPVRCHTSFITNDQITRIMFHMYHFHQSRITSSLSTLGACDRPSSTLSVPSYFWH